MKLRIWTRSVVACLALGVGATTGWATTYYVNDASTNGDVYTSTTGNDANSGTATNTPKATLSSVLTNSMHPGDKIYIDTGTYGSGTVISNTVAGTNGNPIVFQGSTNYAMGGSTFAGSGVNLTVQGKYLDFADIRTSGGSDGVRLNGASYCNFLRVWAISNSYAGVNILLAGTNGFRRCVVGVGVGGGNAVRAQPGQSGNLFENSFLYTPTTIETLRINPGNITNMTGCIIGGSRAFIGSAYMPDSGSHNVFYGISSLGADMGTLSDLMRLKSSWFGNTVADPMFVNADGFDYHLISGSGYVTNGGGWVTNAALGYSPAIDFGDRLASVGDEQAPNGGRVNVGLYGGTAEASKSRADAWLFALSYNDGGNLIQTGRLEWVASTNFGPTGQVALQYSTNNGVSWSNITTLAATNESYNWAPAFSHPYVLWRVADTNTTLASTNARPFSVRLTTNTTFSFYVNDESPTGDSFCSALGSEANSGAFSNAPKRTLQGLLDTYDLEGGDVVYVDAGDYSTNVTISISAFDSGVPGRNVRIVGNALIPLFSRGSASYNAMELNGSSYLEIENLRLADGSAGLYGNASFNVWLRGMQFTDNKYGVNLLGGSRHAFERCLAAGSTLNGFNASSSVSNQWLNGVMWGASGASLIYATSNALAVSNSILGGATSLFSGQVVPGDFNLVWSVPVGLTYSTFSALQNSGLGWARSLFADPLFANSTNGDYHVKSVMGRYDTNTHVFATNDLVHSPAIDLGDPSVSVSNEPAPNGSRLNAGLFGGTAQASKSRTNAWLQTLSYMDGGTLDAAAGTTLRWNGGAYAATSTVTIWLSKDNGETWSNLVVGVNATNGAYFYQNTSTNDRSSLVALWRVTLDADTNIWSRTATNFNYRNGAYAFYVNDSSTNGDVYCTTVGSDGNLGISPGTPMATLTNVIGSYKLGPGDLVYVDTGNYPGTNVIVLTSQDSGTTTNPVVILGSTNRLAGGSVIGRTATVPAAVGIVFQSGSSNIVLRDLVLTNMNRGVAITNATGIVLDGVEVRGGLQRAFDLQGNARSNQLLRCVAHGGGIGAYLNQVTNITIRHSVFWQNTNAIYAGSQVGLLVENSILASTNANAILFSYASMVGISLDYNGLYAGPLARVGANRTSGGLADNLAAWQTLTGGMDLHSIPGDPQMACPGPATSLGEFDFDYHLKTEQTLGRLLPNGQRTSDLESSPLLDAGNPATDASAEPTPNGGRVNIGRFGGTAEASIAPVTPWLKTVSFGDAGIVTNGTVPLVWTAGGGFSNQTVKVEVSVDGGKTWEAPPVASGTPATNGIANWTVSGLPDTPAGAWRVVCLENTNISARSANFFAIRNLPLNIFVNGLYTNDAIYTTAPGQSDNWMATSNAPLNSVRTVFDRFDLEPGDQIWVDTGTYLEAAPILIGLKNSGTTGNPVRVTGTPAAPYTGTVLARSARTIGAYGIQLSYANGVRFGSLMVSNAYIGIHAQNSLGIGLDRVRLGYCLTNAVFAGANAQMDITGSIIEQSLSSGLQTFTGSVVKVYSSLFRDNAAASLFIRGGSVEVKNSILKASGSQYVYYWGGGGTLVSDYNNIRVSEGANVAGGDARAANRFLIDWQTSSASDKMSSGYEPLFANESALDFHLKSAAGRYDPVARAFATNDVETSMLIDLGVPPAIGGPASVYTNEPAPNGSRINVGLYGNTVEASKSSTNGSLVALTLSDGGSVRDTITLYWTWNNLSDAERVNVQFSGNGGSTWTNLATDIYVNTGTNGFAWNTTNVPSTSEGLWQVLTTNGLVVGRTPVYFAVRNDPLAYYVNDASTNGDVYCTAIGRSTNSGLRADSPLNSLATLLGRYGVTHGDTVYVDTGIYPRTSVLPISIPGSAPTNYLVIQGSSNEVAGGTVFTNSNGAVIELANTRNIELRDLRLHGGNPGLLLTQASSNRILRVRSVGAPGNAFELGTRSDQNQFVQCAALNFFRTGFHVARALGGTVAPATNYWNRGVISPVPATSNGTAVATGALVGVKSGRLYVSNSVFVANSPAHAIYSVTEGAVAGEYNAYHRPYTNSIFAEVSLSSIVFGVQAIRMEHLSNWAAWNQSDSNSLAADPLFVDLAGGDLHPRSAGGHYVPATSNFVEDAETSPLIDAADPTMAWSQESDPHGSRANLGIYGNTFQASRTPTNGTFVLLSFNEGGVARGTNAIRWIPRGQVTNAGHRIDVQLSTNSGINWQTIGVSTGSLGSFLWNSTTNPSLPTARLRLRSQSDASAFVISERDFAIHNSNMTFYVNDASITNNLYTTAPGSSENTGLQPDSPLASLAEVLARYDVEPGDTVLIDTGNYSSAAPIAVEYLDSGTAAEPVVIRGSTNAPGTTFGVSGIRVENARGILLQNVRFLEPTVGGAGATVDSSEDVVLDQVDVFGGMGNGFTIRSSSNVFLNNFSAALARTNGVASEGSFNTRLDFGTIWSNGAAQVLIRNQLQGGSDPVRELWSSVSVSNCVLGAFGIRVPVYEIRGTLRANYNDLYLANGALAALSYLTGFPREFDSVGVWVGSEFGLDSWSLSHEPRFADAAQGDFHPKSTTGRWVSVSATWTNDPVTSPLIDAGDHLRSSAAEPDPNGGRVNIGRHGNSGQASKTPTNSALSLVSFNDGGRASGTNVLIRWNPRGYITNGTLSIYYSSDGGSNWTTLVTGISASAGTWTWNSTLSAQSVQGRLKIVGEDGCQAVSEKNFSVRNDRFFFYINDSSTNNDVYCTAVGLGANSGLSSNEPMSDFNDLLAKYDLEGGDVVYIDTGVYTGLNPWRITQADSAGNIGTNPVVFQGSTNSLLNGTVLKRNNNDIGVQADYAVGIRLRNIVVSNTMQTAVAFNECYDAQAEWIAVGTANVGFRLNSGSQLRIAHSLVVDANQGVVVENWDRSTNTIFPVIEFNALWETDGYAIQIAEEEQATVRHNVLSVMPGEYIYGLALSATLTADYNSIWLGDSGRVSRREQRRADSPVPIIYDTVGAWSAASRQDLHSCDGDPLLVDSTNRDFHLQSRAGHWSTVLNAWTNDEVSSPLIDMGSPDAPEWTNEPPINGSRVNVGLYGGSPWASKSETNSALHLLTLNRGGVASGQVALNWMASGLATGHTVRLEYSVDDGATWNLVAEGVSASLGGITWNSSSIPSSPLGRWRILDEMEAGVEAASEFSFVLHNGPVLYYVNDDFTTGDMYCNGAGSSTNAGISPDAPKRWISEIVDAYNLEPGDIIYVDTGYYQTPQTTTFGDLDAGGIFQEPTQQVNVVGSTNVMEGGSLYIISDPKADGFHLDHTYGIRFDHLDLTSASNGVLVDQSYYVAGEWMNIRGCVNAVRVQNQSSNTVFRHSTMVGSRNAGVYFSCESMGTLALDSCLSWSNRYGVYLDRGYVDVSNSIFGMVKSNSYGYFVQSDRPLTELRGDYNNLYVEHAVAAAGALQTGSGSGASTNEFRTVSAWSLWTGQDGHSLPHNPQLADPGNGDYHLKSAGGRYEVGAGWVTDTVSSALIDAGDPASMGWTVEPNPNGRRQNIGLYGGTAEASKTPSNGMITCIYPAEGSRVSGVVTMLWSVVGMVTSDTVQIEYSADDAVTWTNIVSAWPASTCSYPWDASTYQRSALGWWRITCEQHVDINDKAGPFIPDVSGSIPYYVNDSSRTGDVYCTATGTNTANGLTPGTPKASLQAILDKYDLSPEDIVYVDAGNYVAGSPPIKIDQTDSGWSNLYVTIQGSTNPAAPTTFTAPSFSIPYVFSLEYATDVRLKNLTIRNATVGLMAYQTDGCEFDGIRIENNRAVGLSLNESYSNRLTRSVLWKNASSTGGIAMVMSKGSIAIENSVLWGSFSAAAIDQGALTVTNSVLYASGSDGRIYQFGASASATNGFRGDYNSYIRKNDALIGEQQARSGRSAFYDNLPGWGKTVLSDLHSMSVDPAFANEVNGDFHPKSTRGRFVAATGSWTNDTTNSPLIDAGCPAWAFENEPEPNGDVINIGAYGNTAQASMTQTNPPWMHAVSYDGEGVMANDVLLYWRFGGLPVDSKVRLEYSTDYLISWHPIASNVPVSDREYSWDVRGMPLSLALSWRVVSQANTNAWDYADPVKLKPGVYDYFVNDAETNGDVWCTGPGLACNNPAANPTNRATPVESLYCLFTHYPVGPGDRVFVDTGTYPVTKDSPVLIGGSISGDENNPLRFYGSTNFAAGGALFLGNGTANGFDIQNTANIEIYDFRVSQAQNGMSILNAANMTVEGVELCNSRTNGFKASNCGGLDLRNLRLWGNAQYGYYSTGSKGGERLQHATIWGNRLGAVWTDNGLAVSNSILCVTNGVAVYLESGSGASIAGDYNMYGMVPGSILCSNRYELVDYVDLRHWQDKGRDVHSLVEDPLFVNPAAGDFHLQSRAGYWATNGTWPVSTNTSWAIDAGDPASGAVSNEPAPNGGRVNLGAYGGTPRASLSDTNHPGLLPTTLRDGGVAPDGQPLYWLYRGLNPTNLVQIEWSPDNGATWLLVANGLPVGTMPFNWFSACVSSPEALWRLVLTANTNVFGATTVPFTRRPCPLTYYVNDSSTDNDVYTTAVGSSTNRGYSPDSPMDSIQNVLTNRHLLGGDEIKVDTGVYGQSTSVFISASCSGDTTNQVRFTGSTNWAAGGSRIQAMAGTTNPAFKFHAAHDVRVSNFSATGFPSGLSFAEGSLRCTVSDADIHNSTDAGVKLDKSQDIFLERVLVRAGNSYGLSAGASEFTLEGCVIWSNRLSALFLGPGARPKLTNSALSAYGTNHYCYESPTNVTIQADYNNLYIRTNAQIALINGLSYEKLPQWVKGSTMDGHSLSTDPWFIDATNGDFHLQSTEGRYQVGTGWVSDPPVDGSNVFSRMIDTGAPLDVWSNEPAPNGSRLNIGLHGNTDQASKSNTNDWLLAITAMSGGSMNGAINLVWAKGDSIPTNARVQLEYSYDQDWIKIGETTAGAGEYYWQSDLTKAGKDNWPSSPAEYWRIFLLTDTNVWSKAGPFTLRNKPLTYYMNDTATVNDVYTTAPGNDTNNGYYARTPKLHLVSLLEDVDIEPADRVLVDTGIHYMENTNAPVVWEASDGGSEGLLAELIGSTNAAGSWFLATNRFSAGGFFFMQANYMDIRKVNFIGESIQFSGSSLSVSNLILTNGSMQVRSDSSKFKDIQLDRGALSLSGQDNQIERLRQRWGESAVVGTNASMLNSVVYTTNSAKTGVVVDAVSSVLSNCTVVAPNGTALGKRGVGTLRLKHNILVAGGTDANSVIAWVDGGLISDWNDLWAEGSAWCGIKNGKWEKLAYWQAASGQDANSVSFDPQFEDSAHGDFHLESIVGRWNPLSGWETDPSHSPVIDLGDPFAGTSEEPPPNGNLRNLGAYGGTAQASKSRTNFWLTALTMNDGGVLKGPNVVLRWATSNNPPNLVRLEYFDGTSWTNIATGIPAKSGSYVWDTTGFPDSFSALWRVVDEGGSGVSDVTDNPFALRNQPHDFFVNDAFTNGDIYCSAAGSAANSGLSNSAPKRALQQILDAYDLEGGDRVYLDTGTYSTNADIRIVWSRSGDDSGDVIIQGNTNNPYATVLTRSGSTNYPAVGIDVKASKLVLAHLSISGIDRAIGLESNQNVTVYGVVAHDAATGVDVKGAQGTDVRNSAFWRTGIGVHLENTRTSLLENLTFAGSTLAGIQLQGSVLDTLQNNIFIPAENAYAYSIGGSISLLKDADMDYNLYDFNAANSTFFEGATNYYSGPTSDPLRRWQIGKSDPGGFSGMNRDFRSAITNADLMDTEFTGDFHPQSVKGRWNGSGWTMDGITSWAVDHGSPDVDFVDEPTNNGARINVGMYGGTVQASRSDTNAYLYARTMNETNIEVTQSDQVWPWVWSAHLLDDAEWVLVQFSGDGGATWTTLTNVSAKTEYYVWQATVNFQTAQGRWRVVGVTHTNLWDMNDSDFLVRYRPLGVLTRPYSVSGLMRFEWEGGVQGRRYRIEFSDNFGQSWTNWPERYNGPATINKCNFVIPSGGSQLYYTFEDRTSYLRRTRLYRIVEIKEE